MTERTTIAVAVLGGVDSSTVTKTEIPPRLQKISSNWRTIAMSVRTEEEVKC